MPNAVWPASLPQKVLAQDYEEVPVDNAIRSQMAVGFKSRLRDTKEVRQFTVSVRLTAAQASTLRAFYRDTLAHGTLPFDWIEFKDPNTAATYVFTAVYRLRAFSRVLFVATLNLTTV